MRHHHTERRPGQAHLFRTILTLLLAYPLCAPWSSAVPLSVTTGPAVGQLNVIAPTAVGVVTIRPFIALGVPAGSRLSERGELFYAETIAARGGLNEGRFSLRIIPSYIPADRAGFGPVSEWIKNETTRILALGSNETTAFLAASNSLPGATAALAEIAHIPAIAPHCSDVTLFQCDSTLRAPCTKASTRRFQYLHAPFTPASESMLPWIQLLRLRNCKSIAFIWQDTVGFFGQTSSGGQAQAIELGIEVVMYEKLVSKPAYPLVDAEDVEALVARLIDIEPEAVVLATNVCQQFLPIFKRENFNPKAMYLTNCIDIASTEASMELKSDVAYAASGSNWNPDSKGTENTETVAQPFSIAQPVPNTAPAGQPSNALTSPQRISRDWHLRFVGTPEPILDFFNAAVLISYVWIEAALIAASGGSSATEVPSGESLNAQIRLVYEPTFYGWLATNRFGQNSQKSIPVIQRQLVIDPVTGEMSYPLKLISPIGSANAEFIFPAPRWDERVYTHRMYATSSEQALIALVTMVVFVQCLLGVALVRYRSHASIKGESLLFSLLTLLGSIIACLSILTWPIENNAATCGARVWTWTLGFTLFTAPMVAKSRRIASIFSGRLKVARITDQQVATHVALLLIPQLVINIIWSIAFPLSPSITVLDPVRPSLNLTSCKSDEGSTILAAVTVSYGGCLLVYACILAMKVRQAYSLFSNARAMANAVFIFSLISILIVAFQLGLSTPSNEPSIFIIRSILVLLSFSSGVALLILPQFLRVILSSNQVSPSGGGRKLFDQGNVTTLDEPGRPKVIKYVSPAPALNSTLGHTLGGTPIGKSRHLRLSTPSQPDLISPAQGVGESTWNHSIPRTAASSARAEQVALCQQGEGSEMLLVNQENAALSNLHTLNFLQPHAETEHPVTVAQSTERSVLSSPSSLEHLFKWIARVVVAFQDHAAASAAAGATASNPSDSTRPANPLSPPGAVDTGRVSPIVLSELSPSSSPPHLATTNRPLHYCCLPRRIKTRNTT